MTQLPEIVQYLDQLLETTRFADNSVNGLQVDASWAHPKSRPTPAPVSRVALAVDAGESTIRQAIDRGAQMLVVHHGLFWGKESALVGALGRKISLLMRGELSLYTSHLPLDGHMEFGNNVGLAKYFGAQSLVPFFEFGGAHIGCRGEFVTPLRLEAIAQRAKELVRGTKSETCGLPRLFSSGKDLVKSVGFLSGSGSSGLPLAAAAGLDLIISGEFKHEVYHATQELGINALFCGHYQTETFGVRSLGEEIERQFGLETLFIDDDSGI